MKCPSCSANLKSGTVTCPNCRRYCGRTFGGKDIDTFSSFNRTPDNCGYTQQSAVAQDNYTNPNAEAVLSRDDEMFFSQERNDLLRKSEILPENEPAQHNSEQNPYVEAEKIEANHTTGHETEYVAHNIVEFSHHMFGAKHANAVNYLFILSFVVSLVCLSADLIIDKTHISTFLATGYLVTLLISYIIFKKTLSRKATTALAVVTIIYSIGMIVLMSTISKVSWPPELFFIYIPLVAQNVMSLNISKHMGYFYEVWLSYKESKLNAKPKQIQYDDFELFNSSQRTES